MDPKVEEDFPRECPFCMDEKFVANNWQEEIGHMEQKHPDIIKERLERM